MRKPSELTALAFESASLHSCWSYFTGQNNAEVTLLHSLLRGSELPVHGEGEAEEAARVPAPPQRIDGVQIKSGQPRTSRQEDEQPQSGHPVLHEPQSGER